MFPREYNKSRARLDIMSLILYLECDEPAKSKFGAADTIKNQKHKGMYNDGYLLLVIDHIIMKAVEDTLSDRI